jgi:hypothetical protein
MLRCINDGVTTIKPGHQTTGNVCMIWSGELSFMLFPASIRKSVCLENTQGSLESGMPGSNSETWGRFCDGLGSSVMVQYSFGPIIILHVQITARSYVDRLGNQVHLMILTLCPNNAAVFQDDNALIHTAGTVQSWFDEHAGELHHSAWGAQSPDLNTIEPLWPVLKTRVKNKIPMSNISKAARCFQE